MRRLFNQEVYNESMSRLDHPLRERVRERAPWNFHSVTSADDDGERMDGMTTGGKSKDGQA